MKKQILLFYFFFINRFLGSEETAMMTTGGNIVLFAIFLFLGIFLFRLYNFRLKKKGGFRLVLIVYIPFLFFISLFYYFLRIYALDCFSLYFSSLFSGLVLCVGGGGKRFLFRRRPPAHRARPRGRSSIRRSYWSLFPKRKWRARPWVILRSLARRAMSLLTNGTNRALVSNPGGSKSCRIIRARSYSKYKGATIGPKFERPWSKLPLKESITDYFSSRIGISGSEN